jgi:hypothetical protein
MSEKGSKLLANSKNRHRINHRHLLTNPVFRGQGQGHCNESGITAAVEEEVMHTVDQVIAGALMGCRSLMRSIWARIWLRARRWPASQRLKGIGVVGHQQAQFLGSTGRNDPSPVRKNCAERRQQGVKADAAEKQIAVSCRQCEHGATWSMRIGRIQRDRVLPLLVEQSHGQRHEKGLFVRILPGGRTVLLHLQDQLLLVLVIVGPEPSVPECRLDCTSV